MAHAAPEFALAARAYRNVPEPTQATLGQLRARMRQIGDCIRYSIPHSAEEAAAYHAWRRQVTRDRQNAARDLTTSLTPGKAMHGGDARGERFVPPVRRGEGRTKRWQLS